MGSIASSAEFQVTDAMLAAGLRVYDEWFCAGGPDESPSTEFLIKAYQAMLAAGPKQQFEKAVY